MKKECCEKFSLPRKIEENAQLMQCMMCGKYWEKPYKKRSESPGQRPSITPATLTTR